VRFAKLGRGRPERVEISVDGGKAWTQARLQDPVLAKAHTRFRHLWHWTGGEAVIMSRAVDETGYVQPARAELFSAHGPGAANYHLNPITSWIVKADGSVV
jgi:sulfane dehydrogenase subunit SoxC